MALAHGQDPVMLTFDQGAMREHLKLCLQAIRMDPFPTLKKLKFKKNRVVGRKVEGLYAGGSGLLERMACTSAVQALSGTMKVASYHYLLPTLLTMPGFVLYVLEHLYRYILHLLFHFYFFQLFHY